MKRSLTRRSLIAIVALLTLTGVLAACGSSSQTKDGRGATITLLTHDSFAVSKPVLAAFEQQSGITVKVLHAGDAGKMVNEAILTKDKPLGDVLFGVDNTLLTRALQAGIFDPYKPAALANVPATYQLDTKDRAVPIDYGHVCVNYDKAWYADHHIAPPTSLQDLTKPQYKDQLVVEDPSTSSTGLAFLIATVAANGDGDPNTGGWQPYWQRLRANGVKVDEGWSQAYDTDFSGSAGKGPRPLVVSYASSPPAEVLAAKPEPTVAPTGVLLDTCFRQVELAGVLKGTKHPKAARAFVDFMLSKQFQADMPLEMYVYPVVDGVPLPAVFQKFSEIPKQSLDVAPARIAQDRDRWIQEWTSTVLR